MDRCERPLRLKSFTTDLATYFPLKTNGPGVFTLDTSLLSFFSDNLPYTLGPEVTVNPWLKGFSFDFLEEMVTTPKLEILLYCSPNKEELERWLLLSKADDLTPYDELWLIWLPYLDSMFGFILLLSCFSSSFLVCSMARLTSAISLLRMLKKG